MGRYVACWVQEAGSVAWVHASCILWLETLHTAAGTPLLHESQNGFRPKRSCADHQSVLSEVLGGRKAEGKDSYVLLVHL
jgi:hypothetical protein